MTTTSQDRPRPAVWLAAGCALGFASAGAALASVGLVLLAVGGIVARQRAGGETFLAFAPAVLLLCAPVAGALAVGLATLGVRAYRRL